MTSLEALLQSKFGARTPAQVDQLLEAMRVEEADPEKRLVFVKILKATIKDEALSYFIDQKGLTLIHGWLKDWTSAPDTETTPPKPQPDEDTDKCVETLKLLRQLPVNVRQLEQNAELCRFLRHLSKSNREDRLVKLAKEVVDLWKKEVRAGTGLFLQREQRQSGKKRSASESMSHPSVSKSSSSLPAARDTSGAGKSGDLAMVKGIFMLLHPFTKRSNTTDTISPY